MILQAIELSSLDQIFVDSKTINFRDVPLKSNTDYMIILYVKTVTAATGITSISQLNFGTKCSIAQYNSQSTCTSNNGSWDSSGAAPQISVFARSQLHDAGLWIFPPTIEFR